MSGSDQKIDAVPFLGRDCKLKPGLQFIEQFLGCLVGSGIAAGNPVGIRQDMTGSDTLVHDRTDKIQFDHVGIFHQDAMVVEMYRDDVNDLIQKIRVEK